MNTTKGMFEYYLKNHSLDAIKQDESVTPVFFKEMTDTNNDDRKYLFCRLGELNQGEIITVDGIKWMITQETESLTHRAYSKMIVLRLNHIINFGVGETLYSYDGAIELGNQGVSGTKYPLIDGKMIITLPRNEHTEGIKANDRIIKFNSAWTVEQVTTEYLGLVTVYLGQTATNSEDDLINEIPAEYNTPPVVVTDSRWDKTVLEVIEDYTDTASIYEYIEDVATDTTFTFRVEGIDSANYSIQSTTGNSITILCKNYYYEGTIIATNSSNLEEISLPLVLKSLFG